jgi:hypothetical protein
LVDATRWNLPESRPALSGVPHRIKYFEAAYEYLARHAGVVFWTSEQILDWYLSARPA